MNDWNDLKYFLALARSGTLTGAARDLAVQHSTVSRRITAFEERYNVRLFDRGLNGYTLTQAGTLIFEQAVEIELKHLAVDRLMFGHDSRLSGSLCLTMPHDLANFCVLPYLHEFSRDYPDVDLTLSFGSSLKNLNAREADIAVRLTAHPPEHLIGYKAAELRHGIYQSTAYKSNTSDVDRLVLWKHEHELPTWAKTHFPNSKIALKVDDLSSMYAAIKAGIGIARMPCYFPDAQREADVKRLNLPLVNSDWGVWLLTHADLKTTARVTVCKHFLKRILVAQKALFEGNLSNYL